MTALTLMTALSLMTYIFKRYHDLCAMFRFYNLSKHSELLRFNTLAAHFSPWLSLTFERLDDAVCDFVRRGSLD